MSYMRPYLTSHRWWASDFHPVPILLQKRQCELEFLLLFSLSQSCREANGKVIEKVVICLTLLACDKNIQAPRV